MSETPGKFGCPKGVEKKSELFSQKTYHSQNFRQETLKFPLLKKLSVSLLTLKGRSFCRLVLLISV